MEWKQQWSEKPEYTLRELARLCLGWNPESQTIPDHTLYQATLDEIRRAVQALELDQVPRRPSAAEVLYDEHPRFARLEAWRWVLTRDYRAFPYHEQASETHGGRGERGLEVAVAAAGVKSSLPGPNRKCAAWLRLQMRKRGFTARSLHQAGGPDRKTIRKTMDGFPVSKGVRERLARALSTNGDLVRVRDIPTD
jgi:hypothetical protein